MLGVYLEPSPEHSTRVGSLLRDVDGNVAFVVDEAYLDLGPTRPSLSSAWSEPGDEQVTIDRLSMTRDKRARLGSLPAWFANLLPEGALRQLVEREMGVGRHDDFEILGRLGLDLPGAVVVRDEGPASISTVEEMPPPSPARAATPALVKFSLAGVQLKFSMVDAGTRLTMPGRNEYGRVIAKLPTRDYPQLPELEHAAMQLAQAASVVVAESSLIDVTCIEGLPEELLAYGAHALVVRRFDRALNRRVHFEDFAQIFGAVGNAKYSIGNEETNLKLLSRFADDSAGAIFEAVRRTTVNVLLGNGDAHLKNWALLYDDGVTPTLSPAYDIVPTLVFGDTTMALKLGGTRNPSSVTMKRWRRAAGYVDLAPRAVEDEVKRTIEMASDLWPGLLASLSVGEVLKNALRDRWGALQITASAANPFG